MKLDIIRLAENNANEIDVIAKWFDGWYEWPKPYWTYKRIRSRLITMINTPGYHTIFVAKSSDKIIGTLGIARYDDTKKNASEFYPWFVNGFVLEKYRRKGIYKHLLKEAEDFLIKNSFYKVYIRTDWKGLYENLGWEYLKDIILDNGVKERLYRKILKCNK